MRDFVFSAGQPSAAAATAARLTDTLNPPGPDVTTAIQQLYLSSLSHLATTLLLAASPYIRFPVSRPFQSTVLSLVQRLLVYSARFPQPDPASAQRRPL